jgi:glycosyltransferase involved in cell wall biosynthesis
MILFISPYPDSAGEKDGMMQRVAAMDSCFAGSERVYLQIRFFGNLRRTSTAISDRASVRRLNFFLHAPEIFRLASRAAGIYVHSVHNGFRALPLYLFRNVVTDLHGVFPEELRYYGKRAGALLYAVVERIAIRRSRALVVVTGVMAEHLRAKHGAFPAAVYTIPVFDNFPIGGAVRRGTGPLVAIYAGGSQKWQNIDLMMDAVARTGHDLPIVILTPDVPFFERKVAEHGLAGRAKVLTVPKSAVYEQYLGADLGFVLRDDSIVNRAACPTKLVEYLACGVVPVVLQPEIGDFARRGYACIDLQRFINGDLPAREELAAMRERNYRVLQEMRDSAAGVMARMVAQFAGGGGGHGADD